MPDQPLHFHKSLDTLVDNFRTTVTALTWLKCSATQAELFYKNSPNIIDLSSSVTNKYVKVGKSILSMLETESLDKPMLYNQAMFDLYRIFTISVKDIIWEESSFDNLHDEQALQFLKHLRNASAHGNQFYWGGGQKRAKTIEQLPVRWRGKEIKKELEGKKLYMDFLQPGDLFYLLSDISNMASDDNHIEAMHDD